jgi:two-component system, NtrC family, sensor kinase
MIQGCRSRHIEVRSRSEVPAEIRPGNDIIMKVPRLYSIQGKFLFSMTVAAILIGALFAAGFYFQMRNVIENEVRDKAELIFAQVESVQNYVRMTLRPKMYQELPDKFVIEAMSSSFISRSVMEHTSPRTGQIIYRRVAENSRNPSFEATATERRLIDFFRENPQSAIWQGHMHIDEIDHFIMARPVRFEKSCLYCHGNQADAPRELIDQYGPRGFDRVEGSIAGLDFVGLPVSAQMSKVKQRLLTYLAIFTLTAMLFFVATQLVFKRVVSDNVRNLMGLLRSSVKDAEGRQLMQEVQNRDEIGAMIEGVEQLGRHIAENRTRLEQYAAELENRVAKRTQDLARESAERTDDVNLFVRVLHSINECHTRPQLWRRSLPLIAERFGLARGAYVCTFASQNFFAWPETSARPDMPDDYVQLLTHSEVRISGETAIIPVESSMGNPEGLLFLLKPAGDVFRPEDQEILRALGRQLGIAAEYLGALDSILRHSSNLQSIFEGISDPLLLVDAQGTAIVTNKAARELTHQLSGGNRNDGNVLPLLCDGWESDVADATAANLTEAAFETREIKLASGRIFTMSLHPLADSETRRVVVHVSEVTDQRRMLEQVTRSEKMATVGKLAAGLAHEINNPLGVILCYAELLKKTARSEQVEDLDTIIRHTFNAREVLRNLLNFARPKVATDQDTDFRASVEAVIRVFAVQAEKKGAAIQMHAMPQMPTVRIAPQVVEQITANLLLNALDALPPRNGKVTVTLDHDIDAREVVLTVSDNGAGISPADLPHIFDPFFTTKGAVKGTGLGLTMVYGFLQDVGGSIEAFNLPKAGACFILRVPVKPRVRGLSNDVQN